MADRSHTALPSPPPFPLLTHHQLAGRGEAEPAQRPVPQRLRHEVPARPGRGEGGEGRGTQVWQGLAVKFEGGCSAPALAPASSGPCKERGLNESRFQTRFECLSSHLPCIEIFTAQPPHTPQAEGAMPVVLEQGGQSVLHEVTLVEGHHAGGCACRGFGVRGSDPACRKWVSGWAAGASQQT